MKGIPKRIALLFSATIILFLMSCETDKEETVDVNFSAENTTRAAQTDNVAEGTLNIMENAYVENEEFPNPGRNISMFPSCTIITIITNGNGGTIILDFGDSCQLNNGAIVSGKINLVFGAIISGTRTINYTFENYTYNGNGVSGGGEIFRQIANSNGNPQSTVNESIIISFPNTNFTAARDGFRVVEWVEGVGSGTWSDNVYEISGNWVTNFSNGFYRTGEVTQVLVRKLSCPYLVSGKLLIEQENLVGEFNWGNGECDNLATLTINGREYQIILGG